MSANQTASRRENKDQRAILSVTDKTGLVEFARKLARVGRGTDLDRWHREAAARLRRRRKRHLRTHRLSRDARRPRQDAASRRCTEAFSHRRENASHRAAVAEHGIQPIDMVVVNLYAFEKTAAKPGVHFRRTDREHRYRRAVDDPLRRQEFPGRGGRNFALRLRRDRRGDGEIRRRTLTRPPNGGWRKRLSPPPPPTIRPSLPLWNG